MDFRPKNWLPYICHLVLLVPVRTLGFSGTGFFLVDQSPHSLTEQEAPKKWVGKACLPEQS